jgi:RNA 2',3'-cyclic 3'-phosphodiesterase
MNTLFIALPLNLLIKSQLERLCFGLPQVHWTEHRHFHLTILYLGQVDGALQLDIQEALSKIQIAPFHLSLTGVGYFPAKKSHGVIWSGVAFSDELIHLKKMIDDKLKEISWKNNHQPFVPHITLGRFNKIDQRRLMDYLEAQSAFITPTFLNDSFVLMKSQQTISNTTIYEEIARFPLIPPINKLRLLND